MAGLAVTFADLSGRHLPLADLAHRQTWLESGAAGTWASAAPPPGTRLSLVLVTQKKESRE